MRKSNTPEFGAGASTFNEVFGATKNPHDVTRSVAGSSGGAAAALASGTAWLAHGSDVGGSLRNPASFCGVVGMRPSVGRCASDAKTKLDQTLGVQGPMARTVEDVALFLDAMSGATPEGALVVAARGAGLRRARAFGLEAQARRLFGRSRHHAGRPGNRRDHARRGFAPREGRA